MKKVISLLLAVLTCVGITFSAAAVEPADAPSVNPRAVSIPTQMAPASWYDTPHAWTARYYTYSSYIFASNGQELYVDVVAPQPFSVEFVSTDGKYDTYTLDAWEWSTDGMYAVQADVTGMTFYMVIHNEGTDSILSNAYYNVYHPEGHGRSVGGRVVIADVA